jgi:methylenetetrahydrofolate reductase (NADPH)
MTDFATSFEFFPPNTPPGQAKLRMVREELARARPEFFSVTYGAGGATQQKTFDTVAEIAASGSAVAPHLSCVGGNRADLGALLDRYRALGIDRVVALRGDPPSGSGTGPLGEFRYASDLVGFIRDHSGDHFTIEVAAYPEFHPQAHSPRADLEAFATKIRAGADRAITQYFYNADAYFRFRDDVVAAGLDVPIVPGIMPITNYTQLSRFSDACGAEIPRWIRARLAGYGDDTESIRAFGLEVVAALCRRLVDGGAPGLHFYTLNQAAPTLALIRAIGL